MSERDDRTTAAPELDEVELLTTLARRFVERERYDEAAELYAVARRLDPKNVAVKLGLAEARKRRRQVRESPGRSLEATLREEYRRGAIDAAHFLGLAYIYADQGENLRAIECLEIAKSKEPANPALHKLHGRILYRRGRHERAVEELELALRYNPFDREVAVLLGRSHYELKDFERALESSVHAFLLLHEGDREGADRLRRRIRTLKQLLGWGRREMTRVFRQCQEHLHTTFDRLEWKRDRFMKEAELYGEPGLGHAADAGARRRVGQLDLASRLKRLRVWSHLTDEQLFKLTRVVRAETLEAGQALFEHGTLGRDLYTPERGAVAIERDTHYGTFTLGTVSPGGLFGEASFISFGERSATARAVEPSTLLALEAAELDRLMEDDAELAVRVYWTFWRALAQKLRATNAALASFFVEQTGGEAVLALRRDAPVALDPVKVEPSDKIRLFREQGLSRGELMTLATFSKEIRYQEGAYVFQEGDEGSEMYVVLDGKARISKYIPGGGEEALAILDRGDFFGEMSLVDGQPRSADARAHGGPMTALVLDQETVREVLSMDSQASLEFLQLLCRLMTRRLREIDEKVVGWKIMAGGSGSDGEMRSA